MVFGEPTVPKVIFMNENAAIIQCEHVPWMGDGEIDAANRLLATICHNCGIAHDANLRNQEMVNRTNGQRNFILTCISPNSPYLEPLKQKLKETGSP